MTKWYDRVGNTIEMCVDGKWIKGIIVKGERSFDGIINMKTLTGQNCWCGCGGEGVHFRKCDDSDGDLITNADRIRSMSDEKLANHFSELIKDSKNNEYCESVNDWLKWLQTEVES